MSKIEELRELEKRALSGPWQFETLRHCVNELHYPDQRGIKLREQDVRFIEALRNAAPHLLAVAEAAGRYRIYNGVTCPACSVEDGTGLPCYCFEVLHALEDIDKALAALESDNAEGE